MTAFTDNVIKICSKELELFRDGKLREYDKRAYKRVGDYWNEVATVPDYKTWKGYDGRRGSKLTINSNDEVTAVIKNRNQPWSAAFISWVASKAGAGSHFSYAPSHSVYIVRALKAAQKNDETAKFIARRHTHYSPKEGDLIACERRSDTNANFDNYIDFVKDEKYEAHCDFVVGVSKETNKAITIGGNVSHSVKSKEWPLNSKGRIGGHDPRDSNAKVICIIECRL
jgi:hypothetical protein